MGLLPSIVARLHPLLRRPFHKGALDSPAIGKLGERIASLALKAEGCKILCQNFRGAHGGEVDIVCRDHRTLVFAEVKTRVTPVYGRPADAVTPAKQQLIRRGAREWLARLADDQVPARFDVVEVILEEGCLPTVDVLRDAFGDA